MQFLGVHPGLKHRLLVAAARAHHEGEPPCDWTDLTELADISASPRAINRALSHLAEDGLIEGVYTRSGWMHLRATARGVRHAGRAARGPAKQRPIAPPPDLDAMRPFDGQVPVAFIAPAVDEPAPPMESDETPVAAEAVAPLSARFSSALSLRVLALRTQLLQALNVFKTQP
jgi:hypothetical protein